MVVACTLAVATLASLPLVNAAQGPSGAAEKVSQSASARGDTGARALEVDGQVFMGDEIKTDVNGEAQIRFVDNTRMVVGPNARVEVDRFVFSGSTARSVTLNVFKGAFRFITGKSPKQAYQLRTPVVAVGVRGTGFDGFVEAGTGRTTIAVYEGAVQLCDASNQCIVVEAGCSIVVAPPGGGFEQPTTAVQSRFLPYSTSQASLLPQYRLDISACRSSAAPILRDPTESRRDSRGGEGSSGGGSDGGGDGGGDGGDGGGDGGGDNGS
jgi:ferric-dicitrate binding protein FerR (iron transport regulator)